MANVENNNGEEVRLRIAIGSHVAFCDQTIPILVPSLLAAGVTADSIVVFVAGCCDPDDHVLGGGQQRQRRITGDSTFPGLTIVHLRQNSLEYTALVDLAEDDQLRSTATHWLFLHDTCRVGLQFRHLLVAVVSSVPHADRLALRSAPSMSIGVYRSRWLARPENRQRLLQIKNDDNAPEVLQRWKLWGVDNEDYMLWRCDFGPPLYDTIGLINPHLLPPHTHVVEANDQSSWYSSSSSSGNSQQPRRIEFYPNLDLYKSKANWERKAVMTLEL
jgi:hypothetical protein